MSLIRGQFSYSKAKMRGIAPNKGNKFVKSKVGFHLTWLKYKKEEEKTKMLFYIYKNNY